MLINILPPREKADDTRLPFSIRLGSPIRRGYYINMTSLFGILAVMTTSPPSDCT